MLQQDEVSVRTALVSAISVLMSAEFFKLSYRCVN